MKIKLYMILSSFLSIMTLSSCLDASSLMDKEDVGDLYEKDVFKDPTYARYFVNDIYYSLPKGAEVPGSWSGAYLDCATDNGEARNLESDAQRFNDGNWNAESVPLGGVWSKYYAAIRACNKFLENYDYIEERDGVATRTDLEYLRAQVIFLRAFFYAELLKHFGGVPILEKTLHFGSPELKEAKRATFAECVEYILDECDEAITIFRSVNQDWASNNFGRANDGVALALKGKVLALAASPLFNRPNNYPQYDKEDINKELWRYPVYDSERWNKAAKALKAVIDLGRYDLYKKVNVTKSAYETYFVTRNTVEESIFPFLKGPTIDIYYENLPFNFMLVRGKGSPVCYNLPTQDLVAAYEMKNGMLPEQEGSGFRPLHPFSGRDPRLEATVWHDEATFCGIEFQTWRRDIDSEKPWGKDYIRGYSRTGFFLKKFMDKDLNPTNNVTVPNSYPIIRYADILLLYAEVLNEYYDDPSAVPDDAICWAISEVRARAGMPDVRTTFANRGWELTQENVRKLIQNERRVEFAFEEHRFWDIRRWMIGAETQRVVHEQDIILKEDDKTKEYSVREMEKRTYEDHMNLMPIPQSEINKNKNLIQNWGWSPRVVD